MRSLVLLAALLAAAALGAPAIVLDGPAVPVTLTTGGAAAAFSLTVAGTPGPLTFYASVACLDTCLVLLNVSFNSEFNYTTGRQTSSTTPNQPQAFLSWTPDDGDSSAGLVFDIDVWANSSSVVVEAPSCTCSLSATSVKQTSVDIPSLQLSIENAVPYAPAVSFATPASSSPMQGFVVNVTAPANAQYAAGTLCGFTLSLNSADGTLRETWSTALELGTSSQIGVLGADLSGPTGFFPPAMFPLAGYVETFGAPGAGSPYTIVCPELTLSTQMVPYTQIAVGGPAVTVSDPSWDVGFAGTGFPFLINAAADSYTLAFALVAGNCWTNVNALAYPDGLGGVQHTEISLNTTNTAASVAYAGTASAVVWTLSGAFMNSGCTLTVAAVAA